MRISVPVVLASVLVLGAQAETQTALAKPRHAIGGEATIKALTSLSITGQAVSAMSATTLLPTAYGPLEMRLVFPSRYVRIDETPAAVRRTGFDGTTAIWQLVAKPGATVKSGPPGEDFVARQRARVARLLLGMIADTKDVLTVSARAADGGRVRVTGPDGFDALIECDAVGLPVRLTYQDNVYVPGGMGSMAQERTEVTMLFEDRKRVDGLTLPHRIRLVAAARQLDEWRFEKIVLNPKFADADFK
jgi:hypothetical protein